MRCKQVRQKLDAFAAKELAAGVRDRVESHLAACEGCRQSLVRQRKLAALLGAVPAPPVPDGFAERLMAAAQERLAVDARSATPAEIRLRWWTSMPVPMRLAAAAALAISLSLGALMGRGVARGVATPSQSAQADPTAVYNLDSLTEAPSGSLADAYLTLASARTEEGE